MTLLDTFLQAKTRPLILCDIDDTLAWASEAIEIALNARYGLQRTVSQELMYPPGATLAGTQAAWLRELQHTSTFYTNIAPDWHAIDAINTLNDAGYHVTVATHRLPAMTQVTNAWLDHYGVQRDDTLVGPGQKEHFAEKHPDSVVAFDDCPRRAVSLPKHGALLWMPRRPWTPAWCDTVNGVHVFTDWAQPLAALGVIVA